MSAVDSQTWTDANQRYLSAALAVVRAALERQAANEPSPSDVENQALADAEAAMPAPAALQTLAATFGLSVFEQLVLVLCAGIELDSRFGPLISRGQGDPARAHPTFSLALAALPAPHWSALSPAGPLRRWRLIEIGAGSALTASPLRIDECVLHYLTGAACPDERLAGLVDVLPPPGALSIKRLTMRWRAASLGSRSSQSSNRALLLRAASRSQRRTSASHSPGAAGNTAADNAITR